MEKGSPGDPALKRQEKGRRAPSSLQSLFPEGKRRLLGKYDREGISLLHFQEFDPDFSRSQVEIPKRRNFFPDLLLGKGEGQLSPRIEKKGGKECESSSREKKESKVGRGERHNKTQYLISAPGEGGETTDPAVTSSVGKNKLSQSISIHREGGKDNVERGGGNCRDRGIEAFQRERRRREGNKRRNRPTRGGLYHRYHSGRREEGECYMTKGGLPEARGKLYTHT